LHINGVDTGVLHIVEDYVDEYPTLEYITEEEFAQQPAMFGSPWVNNNTRMKILVQIRMSKGTNITFLGDTSVYCWGVMETTDKDNASDGVWKDTGWNTSWDNPNEKTYSTTYLTGYFVITVGKLDASGKPTLKLTDEELKGIHSMFRVEGVKAGDASGNGSNNGSVNNAATKDPMVSINHRGWYKAPENTLSAYRESYNQGFKYVECDVQFTKDGIPVLLHDDTIDRTSNGSGYLSQMTYDEVSKFDFSYDDNDQVNDFSAYRGEKIPTFAEFIALCKELGLHPYIEIKGNMTEQEAIKLIDIVTDAGMTDSVSWLGFSGDALSKIAHNCPTARLVWVITDTNATKIKANNIPFAQMNLMTGQNQVVFDIWYTLATQDVVDLVSEYGIPLEVWTVNDVNAIRNLNPYVTGVTSDMYNAKQILNK
jgi:glycerophosphoryl diester phosphodiesterase